MQIKIKVSVRTNRQGSDCSDVLEFEVEDDATAEEIEEAKDRETKEWMYERIDFWWEDVTD